MLELNKEIVSIVEELTANRTKFEQELKEKREEKIIKVNRQVDDFILPYLKKFTEEVTPSILEVDTDMLASTDVSLIDVRNRLRAYRLIVESIIRLGKEIYVISVPACKEES